MVTNIKIFVWVAVMTLGAFYVSMNASANNVLISTPMMAAPDGGSGESIKWIEVTLESPGTLGVEVMYKVEKLEDVDYLKVKGTLNSDDWTSLKNMSKLKGLDLYETHFDGIPKEEFYNRTSLTLVYLPEGMKTIGQSAFRNTRITAISIPASVISIGQYAFYETNTLTEVNFTSGSNINDIGDYAFYGCTALEKFLMPNTVTSLGQSAFSNCTALRNLSFSTSISRIPNRCFYRTYSLKNVVFPENLKAIGQDAFRESGLENAILPIGLTELGEYVFMDCKSLKYVELPSHVNYNSTFWYCTALETIVCQSCTPPSIYNNDPLYDVDRSKITLKVPSFAIVDYKLDTYWLNFGKIEAMESDPTIWNLYSRLSLTNNRRPNSTPTIGLQSGGSLIVGGDAPFDVDELNFVENLPGKTYGQLVTKSKMAISGHVITSYYVKRNTWYFFTPLNDVSLSEVTHSDDASYVFRYYDSKNRATNGTKNNASWKNVTDDILKAGQGYIFHCNKDGWLQLPATTASRTKALTSTDVTTALTAYTSENAADANWNYIGNPYPCYYDVYYMDFTAPITVRDDNNYKAYSIVDDNFVLAPMQAFFVQKPDEVNSILFKEAGRQIESTVNRSSVRAKRGSALGRKIYNFMLSDGIHIDETRTIINEQASLDYELTCDAAKFMSTDELMPQLYTIDKDGNQMAFNERPIADGKVRLGFYAGTAGTYTLSLNSTENSVQLYDLEADKIVSLTTPYLFNVNTAGTYDNRFILLFTNGNTTEIQVKESVNPTVTVVAGGVEVKAEAGSDITVYRADGTQYNVTKAQFGTTHISLPTGFYIIKTGNKSFKSFIF